MPPLTGASLKALTGHRAAAAVSGGADSVALALWLHEAQRRPGAEVTFAGIIHVNHQLRGQESEADAAFCRALAARLGAAIEVVNAPVTITAGRSPERAARAARYRAFVEAASRLGATCVATAHTADDQAETVLMRLLRGTGSRGLSGIRQARGLYVRPLLACRRSNVRAWLAARHEPYREDSSNADRTIMRNRIRHDLLPIVEQIAPGGVEALARAAALANDDERMLERLAIESAAATVLSASAAAAELDREQLRTLPPAIARRVVRQVLEQVAPNAPWRADHFDAVRRLAARPSGGGSLDLPGVRVERVSNVLRVRAGARSRTPTFAYTLTCGGEVQVSEAGLGISARVPNGASEAADGAYVLSVLPAAFPLTVRNRRPGDRVAMSGGSRKVQDLMVDAKIPRSERDRVPLVVAADGQILWVVGHAGTRVPDGRADGARMVILEARKLEK